MRLSLKINKKEITIADRITLVIEAVADEGYEVELPMFGEKLQEFGIVDYEGPLPKLVEDGRILYKKQYLLEPFLSGDYVISPVTVRFWKKGEEKSDAHEIETEAVTVAVKSILPENYKELQIKEIAGPVELPATGGWQFYAIAAGGLVLLSAAGVIVYCLRRRRKIAEETRIPAHELAYMQLERLIQENLVEKGELKVFYFRISDILRHYIENRFGLHAPERTTEEFLSELGNDSVLEEVHKGLLQEFLVHCDLVKFAEHRPTDEEIQKTFDVCKEFIMATEKEEEVTSI